MYRLSEYKNHEHFYDKKYSQESIPVMRIKEDFCNVVTSS